MSSLPYLRRKIGRNEPRSIAGECIKNVVNMQAVQSAHSARTSLHCYSVPSPMCYVLSLCDMHAAIRRFEMQDSSLHVPVGEGGWRRFWPHVQIHSHCVLMPRLRQRLPTLKAFCDHHQKRSSSIIAMPVPMRLSLTSSCFLHFHFSMLSGLCCSKDVFPILAPPCVCRVVIRLQ